MEKKLTRTQNELFYCIYDYILWNNQSPTLGELSKKLNKDKSTICKMLHKMEKKGYVKIEKGKARGIKVVQDVNNIKLYKDGIKEEKYVKYGFSKSH